MKKIAAMVVAVVAVVVSYNIYKSQNINALSNLALANVEALANYGEGGGGTVYCCGGGECMRVVDGSGSVNVVAGTRLSSPCP